MAIWSCEEKDQARCRNPHGCHCREIEALSDQTNRLNVALVEKDKAMGVLFARLTKAGVDCSDLIP